jgi:hypothetical protein
MSTFYHPKAVYMTGTKKQKMDMSKAIVESIYSMEPPGRFLKQCPGEAGEWIELSRREAADKAAQAMAYAIKGESLKEKRRERRLSRLPPSLRLQQDDVVEKSSQRADRPTIDHSAAGVRSSSVARHGVAAASANNAESAVNDDHASDLVANGRMLLSDNSNLQQQLVQQLLQLSSTTTLPTSSGAPLNANQTGLVQVLAQALQQRLQQQQQHQQLPLQHTLGQDSESLGLQTQTSLQPALLEGLTQLLSQTLQQQQQIEQQQLLLQRLLNQQTVLPSGSLHPPPTLSFFTTSPFLSQGALLPNEFIRGTSSNYFAGSRYEPANNNILQNQKEHNAFSLSVLSNQPNNVGTSIAPQQAPQLDQLERLQSSQVQQQQQLLASSLVASNQLHHHHHQQQSLPLDPFHQARQTALLRCQKGNSHRPPPINAQPSDNAAALSSMEEEAIKMKS